MENFKNKNELNTYLKQVKKKLENTMMISCNKETKIGTVIGCYTLIYKQ